MPSRYEVPNTQSHRPRCPVCSSSNTIRTNQVRKPLETKGTDAAGRKYDKVHWDWRDCKNCGKRWRDKWTSYQGDPVDGGGE